jgi:Na+-transporting NADH:ubiquinone oxidoreductase subunit A
MSKTIQIKKGLDIKLKGKAGQTVSAAAAAQFYAVKPSDFPGLKPRLLVSAGDAVQIGTPLFADKNQPDVLFCSPVSGTVSLVNRGERRKVLEVVVESDGQFQSVSFSKTQVDSLERDGVKSELLKSGLWPYLVQRPFGVLAKPADVPRDIFISGFDSAPLAPDFEFILKNELEAFQLGVQALAKLTSGKVYLGVSSPSSVLASVKGAEVNVFNGPHPAGNVGIQMHHVKPINKGEVVWTVGAMSVLFIGRYFKNGKLDFSKQIAVTGSEVKAPQYYNVVSGAQISSVLAGKTAGQQAERIISGNVLTGTKVDLNGYLGFFDNQITVIPEGNEIEPFGWATPGFDKYSATSTFLSRLFPKKEYVLNANFHGGERAFVVSEQYEKVLPMDILPVYLLKAIIVNDFDKMEQLGIYEVIEEDMALCEYVCTSKIEVQDILRKGMDTVLKEIS